MKILGVTVATLSSLLYVFSRWAKPRWEELALRCSAMAAYTQLRTGSWLLLDDLKAIYERESKGLAGIEGTLTAPEAHQLVALIEGLVLEFGTSGPALDARLSGLKRSLPPELVWTPGAGLGLAGPGILLFLFVQLFRSFEPVPDISALQRGLVIAGIAVVGLAYLLPSWIYIRSAARASVRLRPSE